MLFYGENSTPFKAPLASTIPKCGSLIGTNNILNVARDTISDVSSCIWYPFDNRDTTHRMSISLVLSNLLGTSPGNQMSIKITPKGSTVYIMYIRTGSAWSDFFSSMQCAQSRNHCMIRISIPSHHKQRATPQKKSPYSLIVGRSEILT